MKKIFLFLLIINFKALAQVPLQINYQGVARDAAGNPIANQNIGLQFNISTNGFPNFYTETQPSVPTNSLGLFTTKIGLINPLPANGWQNTPCVLQTSININNAGFVSIGTQTMASVPYALYALNSGATLPPGVRDGQTLRWDSTAQVWKNTNNLTNDDIRVGVGLFPNEIKSKFHATTSNTLDSSAIVALHFNAQPKQAALKAFVVGSTATNTLDPYGTALFGSQGVSNNNGSGFAIGSLNYGTSNGTGVGVSAVGNSKTNTGTAIGVYGTTDPNSLGTNKYAGVFDKGGVLINDSLLMGTASNPGNIGDVLTLTKITPSYGRVKWQTPGTFFSPFTVSANFVHLVPGNATSKVVIGNTTPALFGYSSKLTVYNPVGTNDTALSVFQYTNSHAVNARTFGTGFAVNAINSNAATNSYAGFFDGGLISKGKNSLPTSFAFLVKDGVNTDLLSVKNDGRVGVGTISQTENLQVQSLGNTSLSIISTSATVSQLMFGDASLHSKGFIQYDNGLNTMNIGVNSNPNRIFINNNGSIGLKTNNPGAYDLSIFNPGNNTSLRLNNSIGSANGLVLATNNVSSNLISYDNTPFNFGNNSTTFMTAQPNGNVGIGTITPAINSRLAIKDGHLQSQQTVAPTINGSNGVTASFWNGNPTDVTGIIQLSMGGSTSAGTQASVTFNKTYNSIPTVILTPVNNTYGADAVALNHVYVVASTNGFNIVFNTAYANPTFTMYFNYIVIEGN